MGSEKIALLRELAQAYRDEIRAYRIWPQTPEWEAAVAAVYDLEEEAEQIESAQLQPKGC
jgi:pyrroloquinoline quinone (PQQ) biosynthesis protein C